MSPLALKTPGLRTDRPKEDPALPHPHHGWHRETPFHTPSMLWSTLQPPWRHAVHVWHRLLTGLHELEVTSCLIYQRKGFYLRTDPWFYGSTPYLKWQSSFFLFPFLSSFSSSFQSRRVRNTKTEEEKLRLSHTTDEMSSRRYMGIHDKVTTGLYLSTTIKWTRSFWK